MKRLLSVSLLAISVVVSPSLHRCSVVKSTKANKDVMTTTQSGVLFWLASMDWIPYHQL